MRPPPRRPSIRSADQAMSVLVCTLPGPELSDPVHNSESIIAVADRYAARLKSEIRKELRGLWGTLERRSTLRASPGVDQGIA
jgi:hypothetical protein